MAKTNISSKERVTGVDVKVAAQVNFAAFLDYGLSMFGSRLLGSSLA